MKITNLVEQIFANAVALDQSGGMKNTIYGIGTDIFILNYDHTVLARFRLRKSEVEFDQPVSFKANDYDSNQFEEKDGRITFHSDNGEYIRKKIAGTSDMSAEDVKKLFKTYSRDGEQYSVLSPKVLEMIDTNLSHIEFTGKKGGNVKLTQRNIYSGGIIEIEPKKAGGFFEETLKNDFGPIAMKTNDFVALFSFNTGEAKALKFYFPTKGKEDFFTITGLDDSKRNMKVIIACCLYDEIIKLKEVQQDGGKKQKIRRRQ